MVDWPYLAKDEYLREVLSILFPNVTVDASIQFGCAGARFSISLLPQGLTELDERYQVNGRRFVHFTSIRSLFSILNERGLRMYDVTHANDPNEIAYWLKSFEEDTSIFRDDEVESLNRKLGEYRIRFGHQDPEILALEAKIRRTERFQSIRRTTATLSMCRPDVLGGENALNLWRLYGDGGKGCAIELEIGEPQDPRFVLGNVVYDVLEDKKGEQFKEAHRAFEVKYGEVPIEQVLATPACLHKSPLYRIEQEVRLVRLGSYVESTRPDESDFRFEVNSRNALVRYRLLPLFGGAAPPIRLKRIQFGFGVPDKQFNELRDHINQIVRVWAGYGSDYGSIEICRSPLGPVYH